MNRKFNHPIIKIIIRFISIFSGIIGIVWFALYLGQKSIHYSIEFILFTFSTALIVIIRHRLQSYKIETEEKGKIIKSMESTIRQMDEETQKLKEERDGLSKELQHKITGIDERLDSSIVDLVFEAPKDIVDIEKDLYYSKLFYYAEIDKDGNYEAVYERYGKRIEDGLTKFLRIQTSASYPVESFKGLGVRAFSIFTGKELEIKPVDDRNKYRKVYDIFLDPVVKQGDDFAIKWLFTWPHCVASRHDGDGINLKVFKKGHVDEVSHTLVFPFEVGRPLLQEVLDNKVRDCEIQPLYPEKKDSKYIYSYKIPRPKTEGYIISWFAPEY